MVTLIGINVEARGSPFGLFAFPQTRRGRATKTLTTPNDNSNQVLSLGENNSDDPASAILDSITISKDANEEDDIIQKLVDSLVKVSLPFIDLNYAITFIGRLWHGRPQKLLFFYF